MIKLWSWINLKKLCVGIEKIERKCFGFLIYNVYVFEGSVIEYEWLGIRKCDFLKFKLEFVYELIR